MVGRWRKQKKITLESCVTLCDGLTIDLDVMTGEEGTSRNRFPHKEPREKGIILSQRAVMALTSSNGKLMMPLGRHKREPLRDSGWYSSEDEEKL